MKVAVVSISLGVRTGFFFNNDGTYPQYFIKLVEIVNNDISVLIQDSQSNEEMVAGAEIIGPHTLFNVEF